MTVTLTNPLTAPHILATTRSADQVEISLRVPAHLQWFEGHFPQAALLPGVVQTTWVVEFAQQHFQLPAQFRSMSNMKFMRFILPGAAVILRLRYAADKRELSFEYCQGTAICASGRMGFAE